MSNEARTGLDALKDIQMESERMGQVSASAIPETNQTGTELEALRNIGMEQEDNESVTDLSGPVDGDNESRKIEKHDNKTFLQIDKLCKDIFAEMSILDEKFMLVSEFFNRQAHLIQTGREPEYLTEGDKTMMEFWQLCGELSAGVGKLFQAASMEFKLRTEVYPRLRRMAKERMSLVERQLIRVEEINKGDAEALNLTGCQQLTVDYYSGSVDLIDTEWNIILSNYRNSGFHFRCLSYFLTLMRDWENDIFSSAPPIPDMEDVNTDALFNLYLDYGSALDKESFTSRINESIGNIFLGKRKMIRVRDIMLIKSSELLATFQTHCPAPFNITILSTLEGIQGGLLYDAYVSNPAYTTNVRLYNEAVNLTDEKDSRAGIIIFNGIFLTAACAIPLFTTLGLGWAITWTVLLLLIIVWRCSALMSGLQEKYDAKIDKIKLYAETRAHQQAGEGPKYKTLKEIINKKNSIWIGAIIGFVIGLFFGGIFCVPGAILGALFGSGFDEEEEITDGSDWKRMKTGTGTFSKVLMWILIALIAYEIIYFFILNK